MKIAFAIRKSTPKFRRTFLIFLSLAVFCFAARADEAPAVPIAQAPVAQAPVSQAPKPNAIILAGADGVSYFRVALDGDNPQGELPAATVWLNMRATDSISRIAPDGLSVVLRRDRRNKDAEVVQQLWQVVPKADGTPDETRLPLDTAALATARGWNDFRLRSISGLQWPLNQNRVLLRLTYVSTVIDDKNADANTPETKPEAATQNTPDAKTPDAKATDTQVAETKVPDTEIATQELLGWYDLETKTFSDIFAEPRLSGAEISPNGSFIHVLAARETGDAMAILLNAQGKEQPSKTLRSLRAVGYLYRGWIDDSHILLKKSGQNQLVVFDALRDEVAAPRGLDAAWSASVAPDGASALVFPNEAAIGREVPRALDVTKGAPLDWKIEGELPLGFAAWSADSRFALLLQGVDVRGVAKGVTLLSFAPFMARPIALPEGVAVAGARFVYPRSTPE